MANRFDNFISNFGKRPASVVEVSNGAAQQNGSSRNHSSSISEGISSYYSDLDNLVSENEEDQAFLDRNRVESLDGNRNLLRIKRSHLKQKSKVNYCTKCSKPFKFSGKKFNCRRCGDVFCETCCQYRKRLNADAEPDPQGNIYRVCYKCSDLHTQALGECRSLTEEFFNHRKNKRMIISDELSRLKRGFEESIDQNFSIKNVVSETLFAVKVPEWQKSSKWMESQEVEWCTKCSAKFSLFNIKHHCRVCGSVYCGHCCKSDLLLYYDEHGKSCAKLIGIVGCPDEEPLVACYVPVCTICHDDLEEYQVQQYHLVLNNVEKEKGNLAQVGAILEKLRGIERKVDSCLQRFQENVESRVCEKEYESISQAKNIDDVAKLQGDLSDLFTKYAGVIQGLKQYKLSSQTELKIMRNVTSIKCTAYNEGMNLFKTLKANLRKVLPTEDFEKLQSYANMQAINNTYVMTRQLGFEALKFATKYQFDVSIAQRMSEVDSTCFEELKAYVEASGDDWDSHHSVLNALLKDQLKTRKLVVPSETFILRDGACYVEYILVKRSFAVLYQVLRALKAKSSDGKFTASKEKLQKLLNDIGDIQVKQGGECYSP